MIDPPRTVVGTGVDGLRVRPDADERGTPALDSTDLPEDLQLVPAGSAAVPAGSAAGGGRVVPPSGGVWWMHLLVLVALMVTGAAAGASGFSARGWGNLPGAGACLANLGFTSDADVLPRPAEVSAVRGCTAGYVHSLAWVMSAGLVGTPMAAWLLAIGADTRWRRRLLREGEVRHDSAALRQITTRFEDWCDVLGLQGRRRPRLLLARPGRLTGQPFSSAVPLTRPLVVIPAGYAYLPDGAAQVDVVVAHELAHVQSRDVAWASVTRWARVLGLLLLLVATVP